MTSKQKKRLAILVSIVAGFVLVASVLVAVRLQMLEARERAQRQEGLELVRQGEYAEALKPLGRYIHKNERDIEALNAFVEARLAAETASGGHLSQAMAALRMLVRADPDDTEARLKLLELYDRVGFSSEALDLIDRLDAEAAQRPEVLRYRLQALMRLREYADVLRVTDAILEGDASEDKRAIALRNRTRALAATQRTGQALEAALTLTELRPADQEAHALAVELLWNQRGSDAALEHAAAAAEAHAGDPSFEMLLSMVHAQRNELDNAREFAIRAASRSIEDASLALRLSQHLERLGLHQTSLEVLGKALEAEPDAYVLRGQLAWQYFTAGRFDEALQWLNELDPEDPSVPAKLLIYRGMTLLRAGRNEDAASWLARVEEHRGGDLVEAWIPVLEMLQEQRIEDPRDALRLVRDALDVDDDPMLHVTLGRIRESQGENELAIAAYRDAASRARAWPEPLENLADVLLKTDRSRAALSVAQRLLELSGKRPAVLVTVIEVAAANRDRISPSQRDRLIDVGLQAWRSSPGVPALNASLMELLAASGRAEEAASLAEVAVSSPEAYTPRQLARMAVAAESLDLDAAESFRSAVEQTQRGTAEGVLGRALTLARNGQTQEGWQLLEEKLQRATEEQRESVLLGMAIYRESTGMNGAADIYRQLLEETGNRPEVARRIVRSSAAAEDPELLQQAIDTLREIGGEQGLEWRIGQARYLLRHGEPPRSVNRAIALLDEVVTRAPMDRTARLLLADAHRRTGNTTAAVEQLMQAAEMSPDPADLRLTAAAILIEQGETTRGLATLRNAAESLELTPGQTRRAAALFQTAGRPREALATLESAIEGGRLAPDLSLALLRWQTGDSPGARSVFEGLMQNNLTVPVIERYAQFLRQQGEAEEAGVVLQRLSDVESAAGVPQLILGNHERALGNVERSVELFREAVTVNPAMEPAWRALVFSALNRAAFEQAFDIAAEAVEAMPEAEAYRFLVANRSRLLAHVEEPGMIQSLAGVLRQPDSRDVLAEALDALDALAQNDRDAAALGELTSLANRHSRYYGVQLLCIHKLRAADRPLEAAEIARRTARIFTEEAEPAWLASQALSDAGRWAEALAASEDWRQRSRADTLAADFAIARARLELGDATLAAAAIESYLQVARQNPQRYGPILALAARARLASGNAEAARDLLEPLVQQDERWLFRWIGMSFAAPPDTSVARRWLEYAEPYVQSPRQYLAYGFGWKSAADRFGEAAMYDRATRLLNRVIEASGSTENLRQRAHLLLAFIHDVRDQPDLAIAEYRAVLATDPDNLQANNNLAVMLTQNDGDPEEALRLARRAVQDAPDNPIILETLATAQLHAGQLAEAAQTMDRVLELDPGNPEWQIRLAEIRLAQGDREQAGELANEASRSLNTAPSGDTFVQTRQLTQLRERLREIRTAVEGT